MTHLEFYLAAGISGRETCVTPRKCHPGGSEPILEPAGGASLLTRVNRGCYLINRTGTSVRLTTFVVTEPITSPATVPRPRVPITIWSMAFSFA
jgi:hypothetical protein